MVATGLFRGPRMRHDVTARIKCDLGKRAPWHAFSAAAVDTPIGSKRLSPFVFTLSIILLAVSTCFHMTLYMLDITIVTLDAGGDRR